MITLIHFFVKAEILDDSQDIMPSVTQYWNTDYGPISATVYGTGLFQQAGHI